MFHFRVNKLKLKKESFRVTKSKLKNKKFHFALLTRSWKTKRFTSITNSVVTFLFFHVWVTNSKLKNKKLHFELLAQYRRIFKTQFWPSPIRTEGHHENFFERSFMKSIFVLAHQLSQAFHCVKRVHIRSYFDPYFPAFRQSTERYGVRIIYEKNESLCSCKIVLKKSMHYNF